MLVAGGFGAVAGVLIGALRGQPALRFGVAVGTNFLVAATSFGGTSSSSCFCFFKLEIEYRLCELVSQTTFRFWS